MTFVVRATTKGDGSYESKSYESKADTLESARKVRQDMLKDWPYDSVEIFEVLLKKVE